MKTARSSATARSSPQNISVWLGLPPVMATVLQEWASLKREIQRDTGWPFWPRVKSLSASFLPYSFCEKLVSKANPHSKEREWDSHLSVGGEPKTLQPCFKTTTDGFCSWSIQGSLNHQWAQFEDILLRSDVSVFLPSSFHYIIMVMCIFKTYFLQDFYNPYTVIFNAVNSIKLFKIVKNYFKFKFWNFIFIFLSNQFFFSN